MNKELIKVSLRHKAIYLPDAFVTDTTAASHVALAVVANLHSLGYTMSERLLHAFSGLQAEDQAEVIDTIEEVLGADKNWASLVRDWLEPTGESAIDHFITTVAQALDRDGKQVTGTRLDCGHLIPDGTFHLERYNGCPYCGKPFRTAPGFIHRGQGNHLRELDLWTDADLWQFYRNLLTSPVPLDATQTASLVTLTEQLGIPTGIDSGTVVIKETRTIVASQLADEGRDNEVQQLLDVPQDILRMLWYRHTGYLQLVEPRTLSKTIVRNISDSQEFALLNSDYYEAEVIQARRQRYDEEMAKLRLHYSRPWCRRVAQWMEHLSSDVDAQLESMHPKREMWVRMIRALRLAEFARHKEFPRLRLLLDLFYRKDYLVWQGLVDNAHRRHDHDKVLHLLSQRPGAFARRLFSTMLHFGRDEVVTPFRHVLPDLPPRLVLSLGANAEICLTQGAQRTARTITGLVVNIPEHPLLNTYSPAELEQMREAVNSLYLEAMLHHFEHHCLHDSQQPATIYIEPQLFNIPVPVGDRSKTIQDMSVALQGTVFPVEGDEVRLFLQWGKDLPAADIDMDLSCRIYADDREWDCAYYSLSVPGAKHSGDIRSIPDWVGTAEYIELSLPELERSGARQVVFACNAYSDGALSPNLVVGWMSTLQPMTVDEDTGVAYDPSTVQHMVRITESDLTKGLIFGVLDVGRREITWLEVPFPGCSIRSLDRSSVEAMLHRLRQKPTFGMLLRMKAAAQDLTEVDSPDEASEVYTLRWAQSPESYQLLG